jgi:hypothetical protein
MGSREEKKRAAIERLAGVSDTQATHEHSTADTQPTHESGTMARYDVRMLPADWRALGAAAKREGTSRGAIIRRMVREYLRR